jgi:hypothetical protein
MYTLKAIGEHQIIKDGGRMGKKVKKESIETIK